MSQKAWMNAYTKGSKGLQDKLAKVHAKNPEFQDFIKKHGFGGNLSVKQSGLQKKTLPPEAPKPTAGRGGDQNREQMIKDIATKLRNRRLAASNRASFGGELGGDFSVHSGGFRRYSESVDENVATAFRKIVPGLGKLQAKNRALDLDSELDAGIKSKKFTRKERMRRAKHIERFARVASGQSAFRKTDEDVAYKDGTIAMYKGGWIAKRDGKRLGTTMPTDQHARDLLDATRKSLAQKTLTAIKGKAREVMKGFGTQRLATESAANRRRVRSWDSAIMPELKPLTVKPKTKPPFDADPPKNNPGVVVGKNNPSYSRVRHLARLGLKKAMEQGK